MPSTVQITLAVALIASMSYSAYAISCYQCESGLQSKCGEKFDPEGVYKSDCSKVPVPRYLQFLNIRNATGCMKVVSELNGIKHVLRSCFFGDLNNKSAGCSTDPSSQAVSAKATCDVCTEYLCNGSSATGPVAVVVALFAFIARACF